MQTMLPQFSNSQQTLSDLMDDALSLVARVNEKLRPGPKVKRLQPQLRYGRRILNDQRCLALAGFLSEHDMAD